MGREMELLKDDPHNLKRIAEGKDQADSSWPWSQAYRPQMVALAAT